MTPLAKATVQIIKDTPFLQKDLQQVFRMAATWTASGIDEEKVIAKEIMEAMFKEFL